MVPVGPKPILEHQIQYLKQAGVEEIILGVGHLRGQIKKYISSRNFEGITYSVEHKKLGTGGAIKNASDKLNDRFLVLNGDLLFNSLDLSDFLQFHKQKDGKATILLTEVKDPSRYGVIKLEGNKVVDFVEKPEKSENNLINAGIYILGPEIFEYLPEGKCSLERLVFPELVREGSLYGYRFNGYWKDIGVMEDYLEAQGDYLKNKFKRQT